MGSPTPPVLHLLLLTTALLLSKVVSSCDEIPECQTIVIQATTSQITITGLAGGFFLQNITYINGSMMQASDGSWNNTFLMSFVPGTQYVIYYGNDSISCCRNVTTSDRPLLEILSKAYRNFKEEAKTYVTYIFKQRCSWR
ncbi:uncharacterized protein ACNLHF_007820 isoform 1-T1 [Anomaloglossus baeobatrachus]